jgi:hypothetical protein
MSRMQKRKVSKDVAAIARKAKQAMTKWVSSLSELPSEKEIRAWQAGYIAGINQNSQD